MMNCSEATRLLSEAQDRKLSLSENFSLKMHVGICSGCRRFGSQMASLRRLSQHYTKPIKPDELNSDDESDNNINR